MFINMIVTIVWNLLLYAQLFVQDGQAAGTMRIYPSSSNQGLAWYLESPVSPVEGCELSLYMMQVYAMRGIWEWTQEWFVLRCHCVIVYEVSIVVGSFRDQMHRLMGLCANLHASVLVYAYSYLFVWGELLECEMI